MTDEIYETPSTTPNFQTELAAQLADLIPEAIADGKVDVEKLKELLDDDVADGVERFGLFWPGKKRAMRAAQEPTTATLKPDFENSKDWDTTKNVFIEGDNLEVLKILQKHYHAKIKMIYIDPPYNTGKDFVYPDNYKEGLDTYLEWTRQVNEEGKKVSTNAETEGRYHSNWLNMMYPRLKLARNLLTEDGVIFISIDHNEEPHLRKLADEIFGEANFLNDLTWVANLTGRQISGKGAVRTFERILAYARNANRVSEFMVDVDFATTKMPGAYKGFKKDVRKDELGEYAVGDTLWNHNRIFNEISRPNLVFSIFYNPDTGDIRSGDMGAEIPGYVEILPHVNGDGRHRFHAWRWSREKVDREKLDLLVLPMKRGGFEVYTKIRGFNETVMKDLITNISNGLRETTQLFNGKKLFDYPKSVDLLRLLIAAVTKNDDLVLDFFAGSGTTGHAVMEQNAADGARRKWIQVQLPEPTPDSSPARAEGYLTISALSRRRLELAGLKVSEEHASRLASRTRSFDTGFRAYTLVDTNFAKWRASSDVEEDALQQHLLSLRDSATDDATVDDLLTEILLKQGYSLTEAISPAEVGGLDVRLVRDRDGDVAVLAYLNEHVKPTLEQLRALVDKSPTRIIVLEDAFQGDDELKTNLAQLAKSKGIELWTA
ncbi:site-specific DNA-methyltransferase [Actinomyces provencensis]|uniref:site-specific DNA-methyltransferase n=1 Tax=Actinomyces provencensis TaxID=1720198 RepID=UPI00096A75FD|nr:site-specific DNA-methyltransferase [Actinomyces provencensis]